MLTKKDIISLIEAMKPVFATKVELNGVEKRFGDKMISFKDEILSEIQNLRADVAIVTGYRDMIERHETDIEAIKKRLKVPTTS
jgi:hypothetical protein